MDTKIAIPSQDEICKDDQRVPWHKPTVERLSVTLDTSASGPGGSGIDFGAGSD